MTFRRVSHRRVSQRKGVDGDWRKGYIKRDNTYVSKTEDADALLLKKVDERRRTERKKNRR